jgi:P-type conjugative transfer protein TrbJ
MFKSKNFKVAFCAGAIGLSTIAFAGSVAGTGGATEVTQIMNNLELLKTGMDTATTTATTIQKYKTQLEQYRNQIINTTGLDPMKVNAQLGQLDKSYQSLTNYQALLTKTNGSMSAQMEAWNQRYATAKVAGRTVREQLEAEQKLRDQRNAAAMERAKRDQEILEETRADIQELRAAEASIPHDEGVSKSVQNMHRTMNKIAFQNTRMIEALVVSNQAKSSEAGDVNAEKAAAERRAKSFENYQRTLNKQQQEFITPAAK